jgi:hypothetical protein
MRTTSKMVVSRPMARVVLLLLALGLGRAGRGEFVTPAQKDLLKAERNLEAARGRVSVTAEHLSTTQSLRMARLGVVRACQTAHDAVERVRKQAEKAESIARAEAVEAEQVAAEAAKALESSRRAMEPTRDRFLNQPILAYDLQQKGKLTFNTLTGAFDLVVEQAPGIALTGDDVEELLAGRYRLPDVDPLQLAAEATANQGRLESNYAEVQASLAAEHGASNVYLESRRFLDWATPERIAGDFASASLTSGGSIAGELALARRQIQLEYEDIVAWLRLKGVKDLGPDPSSIVVELIRTGSYPRLGLSIKTRQIEYTRRPAECGGRTEIPVDYLKRLRPKGLPSQPPGYEIKGKRPALAIVWSGPVLGNGSLVPYLEGDFRLSPPSINDLAKHLPPQTDPKIRRLVVETAQHGLLEIDASAKSRRLARAAIGLRREDIEAAADSSRQKIDLRSSDFGEIVASFVSQLALGNRRSCEVNTVELDRTNGRLEVVFTLRHRHAWPSLGDAQAELRRALGPVGTDVEDLADHLPDATFDAARKLYHEADKNAHEAGKLAYEAEQRAHDAIDRIATKGLELAILAGELVRAQTDLRIATEREALARQEAQAACVQMLQLDTQVRLARNRVRGLERLSSPKPAMYGSLDANQRW